MPRRDLFWSAGVVLRLLFLTMSLAAHAATDPIRITDDRGVPRISLCLHGAS
jgi:hypothetical protein